MFKSKFLWAVGLILSLMQPGFADEYQIIISEIHYNPYLEGSEDSLEFVELTNLGWAEVDLSGWKFTNGISYEFPSGANLGPGEYLIISPDPAQARSFYDLDHVEGPFEGKLSNGGEIVELSNLEGRVINRVHYRDGDPWPNRADGEGPSMEFTRLTHNNEVPFLWKSSRNLHGTPGKENSRLERPKVQIPLDSIPIVNQDDTWSYFLGTEEPSENLREWSTPDFDAGAWPQGPGGFGFDAIDRFPLQTEIEGMQGNASTVYIRTAFDLSPEDFESISSEEGNLTLEVSYDDGFIAYINGVEVGRNNVGAPGVPAPFDIIANGNESNTITVEVDPFIASSVIRPTGNILGFQGVNRRRNNGDFYIGGSMNIVRLQTIEGTDSESAYIGGLINEVCPKDGDSGNYIEIFNSKKSPQDLSGTWISTDENLRIQLPDRDPLDPDEMWLLDGNELGFTVPPRGSTYLLLAPDGITILDRLEVEEVTAGTSYGRFPDGTEEAFQFTELTKGTSNTYSFTTPVIINEIHYHPPFVAPDENCEKDCSDEIQWIELHNRSDEEVDLTGWSLSNGIRFSFEDETKIPADGYLVVASNLEAFSALHPEVTSVVGDWGGNLSHDSEPINLNNQLDNRVDRVEYGDGGPTNDVDPEDGIDDQTFKGSNWPRKPDGEGETLELLHSSLDNRDGLSWSASAEAGGTPGATNSTAVENPAPAIGRVRHSPAVPNSLESVKITCRITSVNAITSAELLWSIDGTEEVNTVALRDDGVEPDNRAGNNVFTATIPPLDENQICRFRIRVTDDAETSTEVPLSPEVPPYDGFEGPFFLYEVNSVPDIDNGSPTYRIIATEADVDHLQDRSLFSDVLLPVTFISGNQVRHLSGLRYRGENSRRSNNVSLRVEFASEQLFGGLEDLNLNAPNGGAHGDQTTRELLASDLLRRSGAPYPLVYPVTVRFPGEVSREFDSRYVYKENYNTQFLDRMYDGASEGNLYRARNPSGPGNPNGNLTWRGEEQDDYRQVYQKKSNREEDDYSDIIELCRIFDLNETPDFATFTEGVERLVDTRQWAQFFALQDTFNNTDGGIWNNNGEDYALYRINDDSNHPQAGKWQLLSWDLEETFRDSDQNLFRVTVPTINRFLRHPRYAGLYYDALRTLQEGPFSRLNMNKQFELFAPMFTATQYVDVRGTMANNVTGRHTFYEESIRTQLTAEASSGDENPSLVSVVSFGDTWRFFRGSEQPAGEETLSWTQPAYEDQEWEEGPSGFGYGDGDDLTLLEDMENNYSTVFVRTRFSLLNPDEVESLYLVMDYDDAYVAYIDGVEVGRAETTPDGDPTFDSNALTSHEASLGNDSRLELIDLTENLAELSEGEHTIAIIGINRASDSSDFSLRPAIMYLPKGTESGVAGGCGEGIFSGGGNVFMRGFADPVHTKSVLLDGDPTQFSLITRRDPPYGATWEIEKILPEVPATLSVTALNDFDGQGETIESLELEIKEIEDSFTIAQDVLEGEVRWRSENNPIRVSGTLNVAPGARLVIEPGTRILVEDDSQFVVEGHLEILGTEDLPVYINGISCDDTWDGILLDSTGIEADSVTHQIGHTLFGDGSATNRDSAIVRVLNAKLNLTNSHFANLDTTCVGSLNSSTDIIECHFTNVDRAISYENSVGRIEASTIDTIVGNREAIRIEDTPENGSVTVQGTMVMNGTDDGILSLNSKISVLNSWIEGFTLRAIAILGNSSSGPSVIEDSVMYSSAVGTLVAGSAQVSSFAFNTTVDCGEGLQVLGNEGADATEVHAHSSLFWRNQAAVAIDENTTVSFDHCLTGTSDPLEGENNLAADPLLVDISNADFNLAEGSPAIGNGRENADIGAFQSGGPVLPTFIRGDIDANTAVEITDVILSLSYLFLGEAAPSCLDRLDADDDGEVVITDPIYLLSYMFLGDSPPPAPFPEPGMDPTDDALPCL